MTNINLAKDLAKLPITERLNIMMHYRAAQLLEQPTPISEIEYKTLDAAIKTTNDINAYNKANHAFACLHYQFEHVAKRVVKVSMLASYFKTLWMMNRQTVCLMDAVSYFMYILPQQIEMSSEQQTNVHKTMIEALNNNFVLFHEFKKYRNADGNDCVEAAFKEPKHFQEQITKLNNSIEQIKAEIEEYYKLEESLELKLIPFSKVLPAFLEEGDREMRWLNLLQNSSCTSK